MFQGSSAEFFSVEFREDFLFVLKMIHASERTFPSTRKKRKSLVMLLARLSLISSGI